MGTWKTRGLRGSTLEEYINYSNEKYRETGLALIQKIPTPITPIDIDKSTRHITLAYFEKNLRLTISVWYRGYLYALMQKNVQVQVFHSQMFMNTSLGL